ncbi:MAG: TSCPD domain-containing protein, partial [Desulfuromonadaceae bacterium]|nr:TSCPD domain-containing protein [Desulfuromonadaceae bacterium]
ALAAGQPVSVIIERLRGIECGAKGTSCPDQLASALADALLQAAS